MDVPAGRPLPGPVKLPPVSLPGCLPTPRKRFDWWGRPHANERGAPRHGWTRQAARFNFFASAPVAVALRRYWQRPAGGRDSLSDRENDAADRFHGRRRTAPVAPGWVPRGRAAARVRRTKCLRRDRWGSRDRAKDSRRAHESARQKMNWSGDGLSLAWGEVLRKISAGFASYRQRLVFWFKPPPFCSGGGPACWSFLHPKSHRPESGVTVDCDGAKPATAESRWLQRLGRAGVSRQTLAATKVRRGNGRPMLPMLSASGVTAIDYELRAGYELRFVGSEIENAISDIIGLTHMAKRME